MKILVLTSIYPSSDSIQGFTPVVHYFAKEWVKLGHLVKVVHNQSQFYNFFYYVPDFLKQVFESKFGFTFPIKKMITNKRYEHEGVNVHRLCIFKGHPFQKYDAEEIHSQYERIRRSNLEDDFTPDLILCHWTYPQISLAVMLKGAYNAKCSLVVHDIPFVNKYERSELERMISRLDAIGFRSKALKDKFDRLISYKTPSFICYSGIKDEYIPTSQKRIFDSGISKFLYVGMFLKRKNVGSIIKMLSKNYRDLGATLNLIGKGPEMKNLVGLSERLGLSESVNFLGQMSRDSVLRYMDLADCFIMISQDEAFGLVYLEAMSRGCIVIAAKDEGMDGVIVDGQNGFLCEAGNESELSRIVERINNLSQQERKRISERAVECAKKMTESEMAKRYLSTVND